MPRHALITILTTLLLLTSSHQATAQANGSLSASDFIEIQQLVNKLNFALDYCTNGGQDFANLFTADGEYIIDRGLELTDKAFEG